MYRVLGLFFPFLVGCKCLPSGRGVGEVESALSLPQSWSTLARLAWLVWSLPNLLPSLIESGPVVFSGLGAFAGRGI